MKTILNRGGGIHIKLTCELRLRAQSRIAWPPKNAEVARWLLLHPMAAKLLQEPLQGKGTGQATGLLAPALAI